MVVFSGQGDARRTMGLLWRPPPSGGAGAPPGSRDRLDVNTIVAAGIAVADERGMAALSMRAVGRRLGRTAMALYTHVPGKGELIDLMHDRGPPPLPRLVRGEGGVAARGRRLGGGHLGVLSPSPMGPSGVPGQTGSRAGRLCSLEALVRILQGVGMDSPRTRRVVSVLFRFVRGRARIAAEHRQAAPATGVSDDAWWEARSALLAEAAPDFARRFPALAAMEAVAAAPVAHESDGAVSYLEREARDAFRVGLGLILDGVEAALAPAAVWSTPPVRPVADFR
ncbi:helix-turn-helix domain-containing protein [Streptomyces sp. SID2119]|uniref:helix-turn-helix domain-containing protein n=1 Tax=Streptomyces sp. SID2119 TaxID=2690253 RepID=UPI0031F65358